MPPCPTRIVGIDHDTAGQCSKPKLGYTFDSDVAQALHVDDVTDAISQSLSAALVLHVIGEIQITAYLISLGLQRDDRSLTD